MRILQTADIHLGELTGPVVDGENARMMDTVRCMNYLAEKAEGEQVDAILIAGDLFHKSKLWADQMLKEIGIAANWLRKLASIAPTVLMFGTKNHDNPEAFENIRAMNIPDLHVITSPQLFVLTTKSGPLQVAAVPGFDKGYFRAKFPGMAPEEENVMCSKLLGDIILGLGTQINPLIPSVLMSHYTVVGCELDNGEHIFTQSDIVLPKEAIAASPFDLVCLGHIHRAQEVPHCGRPTFYSGPLNGITFNEEGQGKGFWLHKLENLAFGWSQTSADFIKTPYREFVTMEVDFRGSTDLEEDIAWELAGISRTSEPLLLFPTVGRIVRLHYRCTEEQRKQLSHKTMEQMLYKGGAFYVSEIKPVEVVTALTRQEMNENAGPMENLATWLKKEGFEEAEVIALTELAQPLISTVSAKMPTGKLSGVFEPRRLEVKNYRSYREEAFDFGQVSFATVNGPNGVGKSALFMDAICDCLFEEPREGDLAGWISNDDGSRSGSITFEFGMGSSNWRVIRTRAKSGKTTLALQERVKDQWADRSGDKTRDTQERIIALLGMDAMTFRCCALIMQDAYGLFMEADKTERMEVLANILGLNIYEQLTELAKSRVTEVNRDLTKSKDKLVELNEKLKVKPDLEADLAGVNDELKEVSHDIEVKTAGLKEAEDLTRSLEVKQERIAELTNQVVGLDGEIAKKQQDKSELQKQLDRAQKMVAVEDQILSKAEEFERVKGQVLVLQTKKPRLDELKADEKRIVQDVVKQDEIILKLQPQIQEIEKLLSNKAEFEVATVQYRQAVTGLEGMDALGEKHFLLQRKVLGIEAITDPLKEQGMIKAQRLKTLQEKAAMLENSGCVDPSRAKCKFLADAVESKTQIAGVEAEIVAIQEQIKPLEEEVAEIERQMEALNYDPSEHKRLKDLVSELRPKAEQAAQLSAKADHLKTLQDQKSQAIEQKDLLVDRLIAIKAESEKLATELAPLAELEARLPKLEQWAKAKDELPAAKQIAAMNTERIAAIDTEVAAKEDQVRNIEKERDLLCDETAGIDGHRHKTATLSNYIKSLQERQNNLHAKAGGISAKLEALSKDEEERQLLIKEIGPTAKLLVRYQTLAKAFGFDGIPFSIVRTVVPELSAMANEILGQMTGGKMSLEMRTERVQKSNKKEVNALEIWITDYQRGSLPYKSRSGGQKVKGALSAAFALADLKARRAGIQLGMLWVDEPPYLDSEGTEAYCDALEALVFRYTNMKVIAISHDPRMKARFPQQIMVEDTGEGGSKVRFVA